MRTRTRNKDLNYLKSIAELEEEKYELLLDLKHKQKMMNILILCMLLFGICFFIVGHNFPL
jgi:multisubunit Na+/H+ antiporter MnhB subunit